MSRTPDVEKQAVAARGEDDSPQASEGAAEARPDLRFSPVLVFGIVFLLLAITAASLIVLHPTARTRATALVSAVLRRSPPAGTDAGADQGTGPGSPGTPGTGGADALAAERAALAAERARLEALEGELSGLEAILAQREEALAAAQSALDEQIAKQAAFTADLNRMVRICQQMRPREAAELMEQLDDAQALTILLRLAETSAAQILGAMSRDRAAQLIKLMVPAGAG